MSILVDWHTSALTELLKSREIAAGIEAVAERVAAEMSHRAPRDEDSDHFADHITTASGTDAAGVYVEIGVDDGRFYYWRFVEFGTKHAPPEPFVRPSLSHTYTV